MIFLRHKCNLHQSTKKLRQLVFYFEKKVSSKNLIFKHLEFIFVSIDVTNETLKYQKLYYDIHVNEKLIRQFFSEKSFVILL